MGPLYAVPSASGTAELRPKAPRSLPPPPRTPKPNPAPRCGPPPARARSLAACSPRSCVPTLPRASPAPRQGGLPRRPRCPPAPSCPAPRSPRPAAGAAPAATSSCPYSGAGQGGGSIPRRPPSCRGGTCSLTGTGGERGGGAGGRETPGQGPVPALPAASGTRTRSHGPRRRGGRRGSAREHPAPRYGARPGTAHSERRAGRLSVAPPRVWRRGRAERSSDEPAAVLAPHGSWCSAGTPSSEVRGGTLPWGRRPSPAPFSTPGKWGRLPVCTENLLPASAVRCSPLPEPDAVQKVPETCGSEALNPRLC